MRRSPALLALMVLAAAACGDDTAAPPDPAPTTISEAEATTTVVESTTSTTEPAGPAAADCPEEGDVPVGADDVLVAPVAFDGDGDGRADQLRTYRHDDTWWVRVDWAAGGSSTTAVPEAFMGARALGGYDLDGDGRDEAFVAVAGPAAGSLVAVFRTPGCDLLSVVDAGSSDPFLFPVTATVGSFSGATCEGVGDLDLVVGELLDADAGIYEAGFVPYRLTAGGELEAGVGDGATVGFEEAGGLATLDCGDLRFAL